MSCPCIIQSGPSEGKVCGRKITKGTTCGFHVKSCSSTKRTVQRTKLPKKPPIPKRPAAMVMSPSSGPPVRIKAEPARARIERTQRKTLLLSPRSSRSPFGNIILKPMRAKKVISSPLRSPIIFVKAKSARSRAPRAPKKVLILSPVARLDPVILDYLNERIIHGSVDKLSIKDLENRLKANFDINATEIAAYKKHIQTLMKRKIQLLRDAPCAACKQKLDALLVT